MFEKIYNKLLNDLKHNDRTSPIFKHHIEFINNANKFKEYSYQENSTIDDIVVDYIASMTDDYFIDLYEYLFNTKPLVKYVSYFDNV